MSGTQNGIKVVYLGHIVAWFCFLFMVHTMNPPHRSFITDSRCPRSCRHLRGRRRIRDAEEVSQTVHRSAS